MAIQNRRGAYSNFAPSKMVPGEFAVVQSGDPNGRDGQAVYIAFNAGQAKRLSTYEDMQSAIESATEDIVEQIEEGVADDVQAAQAAATTATTKATEAAASATQAAQTVANIIDNTLTQTGKAADAKKVGDEITDLKSEINKIDSDIYNNLVPDYGWVIGGINSAGTYNSSYKYSIRPNGKLPSIPVDGTISCDAGYQLRVVRYSTNTPSATVFISDSGWTTETQSVSAGEYVAPQIRYYNDTSTVLTDTSISEHLVFKLFESVLNGYNQRIDANETEIADIQDLITFNDIPSLTWKIGGINSNGALNNSVDWCIRSSASPSLDRAVVLGVSGTIGCDDGYQIRIARYSSEIPGSTTFVSDTGWTSDAQSVTADELLLILIRKYPTETLEDTSISSHVVWNLYKSWLVNYAASPYYRDIDSKKIDFGAWYETSQSFTVEGFDRDTTYAEVIDAFDDLVSASGGYLTKADLGGIDATDQDDNEYHLYEYTFAAKKYTNGVSDAITPVFLLNCTAHGFEKNAAYATYYFIKDLLLNWESSPALAALRSNVIIKFIPVQNPWGFDRNDRLNENGVNLNRNYWNPHWDGGEQGTSDYGGEAPFDQTESQVTRDWILANPRAFVVMDVHTNGQYNSPEYSGINPFMPISGITDDYYNRIFDVGNRVIDRQSVMLPGEITELESLPYSGFIGRIQPHAADQTQGTLSLWATLQNIIGMTEEVNQGVAVNEVQIIEKFTAPAFKSATEVLGNCILSFLAEYGN